MTAEKVERESENDPELCSIRHYIQSGDWSQRKLPHYLSVKNGLCVLGKLVMRGTRIVFPQSLRSEVLRLAHEGYQGIVKMKKSVANQSLLAQNRPWCCTNLQGLPWMSSSRRILCTWTYAAGRTTLWAMARCSNWCPWSSSFWRELACSSWLLETFLWSSYHAFNYLLEDDRSINANLYTVLIPIQPKVWQCTALCVRGIWKLPGYTWYPAPEISTPLSSG